MTETSGSTQRSQPGWLMPLVTAGFLLSGMAGLIDEVVWAKYLSLFTGGTTLAQTIVLATFMGGLAVGYRVFGSRVDRSANPLRLYALLELGIGLLCVGFPALFSLFSDAYVVVAAPLGFGNPWTIPLKIGFAATAIFLPTFLMGGTLPVLTRAIVTEMSKVTTSVARFYTINSVGAVFGVFAGGFLLVPSFGLYRHTQFSAASRPGPDRCPAGSLRRQPAFSQDRSV